MPISAFCLELKALDASGEFTGFASVYGNVDQGNDVVDPGAFTKTLQDKGKERPLLWQHSSGDPIGLCTLTDTPQGLAVKGRLLLELPRGKDAHTLLKNGVVKGLSIGYETVRKNYVGDVRHLQELKLHEVSLVTMPMNELATVTGVKAAETQNLLRALKTLRTGVLDALEGKR